MMEKEQLTNLEVVIGYTAEMDEFWSFVETKTNQRWTWYAMDKRSGIILAWHNGKRTDEDLQILLKQIEDIPISKYHTDDWGAYSRLLPTQQHVIGKDNTWKIERKNLNFRTHIKRLNRRTICYSKNEQVHDNVIGMYIERYYYKTGTYSNNHFNAFNPRPNVSALWDALLPGTIILNLLEFCLLLVICQFNRSTMKTHYIC